MPFLIADRNQMIRLFQNMIGNSIKYCEEKKPVIHISASKKENFWEFCISDNGIGIDKEYHDIVFELFKRLHTSNKYSGTGMGLAIVKKIIDSHNGKIWIKSESGKGSKFYFTLSAEG